MRVSEVIAELRDVLAEAGDIEVVMVSDVDGRFVIEEGRVLDVIQLPDEAGTLENAKLVCAFLEPPEREEGLRLVR